MFFRANGGFRRRFLADGIMVNRLKSLSKIQILAILLILVGLVIMAARVKGMKDFSREVQYARQNNFAAGNLSPDLLRPWMSLRYIAIAYAVPQKYLYDAIGVRPGPETSMLGINRLNRQMGMGQVDGEPALLSKIHQAILDYRANPVPTGLLEQHVEGWMSVAYIANSTGVPAETILQEINLPAVENNMNKPLDVVAKEVNYSGGPRRLAQDVQAVIDKLAPNNPLLIPTRPASYSFPEYASSETSLG
jgi:hypothetical protein